MPHRLGEALEKSSDHGIRLVGFLDEYPGHVQLSRTYNCHAFPQLPDLLRQRVVDEVIFAVDSSRLGQLEDILLLCDEQGGAYACGSELRPACKQQSLPGPLDDLPLLTFSARRVPSSSGISAAG